MSWDTSEPLWPKISIAGGLCLAYPKLYRANTILAEGVWLELRGGLDNETAALAWLVSALGQARKQGQIRLVDCLETIADDVVFEMEVAARRASLLSKVMKNKTA